MPPLCSLIGFSLILLPPSRHASAQTVQAARTPPASVALPGLFPAPAGAAEIEPGLTPAREPIFDPVAWVNPSALPVPAVAPSLPALALPQVLRIGDNLPARDPAELPAGAEAPSRISALFEKATGMDAAREAPAQPGGFRDLSVPDEPTRDLPPASASAQAARNFERHLGRELMTAAEDSVRAEAPGASLPAAAQDEPLYSFKFLKFSVDEDDVAEVTLVNRAQQRNALSMELIAELGAMADNLARDGRVKSVVFATEGPAFIAGADISDVLAPVKTPEQGAEMSRQWHQAFNKWEKLDKLVVMALHGATVGGGLEFALSGHLRLAGEKFFAQAPEIVLNILPAAGLPQRLPRVVGLTEAAKILLSGKSVDAATSLRLGLVDRLLKTEELKSEARREAKRFAAMDPGRRAEFLRERRASTRPVNLTAEESRGLQDGTLEAQMKRLAVNGDQKEYQDVIGRIWDATLTGVREGFEAGAAKEAAYFGHLTTLPMTKLLTRLMLRKLGGPKVKRLGDSEPKPQLMAGSPAEFARASGLELRVFDLPGRSPMAEVVLPGVNGLDPGRLRALDQALATLLLALRKAGYVVVVVQNSSEGVVGRLRSAYLQEARNLMAQGAAPEQVARVLGRLGLAHGEAVGSVGRARFTDEEIREHLIRSLADEGSRLLSLGVVDSPLDIDIAAVAGLGFSLTFGGPMIHSGRI